MNDEISSGTKPRRMVTEATQVIMQNLPEVLGGSSSAELTIAKNKFKEFQMWYSEAIRVYLDE
jgi:hypothetical protein